MSLKGGYKIIDLKGIDVTQSTMMIEGIYESIESNYGKPLLISGIVINGVEKDDVFVQATLNGTAYEFEIYGIKIRIQDTDAVSSTAGGSFKTYVYELQFNENDDNLSSLIIKTSANISVEDFNNFILEYIKINGTNNHISIPSDIAMFKYTQNTCILISQNGPYPNASTSTYTLLAKDNDKLLTFKGDGTITYGDISVTLQHIYKYEL